MSLERYGFVGHPNWGDVKFEKKEKGEWVKADEAGAEIERLKQWQRTAMMHLRNGWNINKHHRLCKAMRQAAEEFMEDYSGPVDDIGNPIPTERDRLQAELDEAVELIDEQICSTHKDNCRCYNCKWLKRNSGGEG